MDNRKTGLLIADSRKSKNMTQQELAEKLHVTNTAVSKWERGLSFPGVDILENLAYELDITVMDILAGEIIEKNEKKVEEISIDVMKTEGKKRRSVYVLCAVVSLFMVIILLLDNYGPAIFQRGYPVPYIKSIMKISADNPLVEVKEGIYITRVGNVEAVISYVEDKWNVKYIEQAGSGYIFSNGLNNLTISSEIYWGKYTVWDIPNITLQTK